MYPDDPEQLTAPPPMSAQLAKRLAEAADGLRDGLYYFFNSRSAFPFDIRCHRGETKEAADEAANAELVSLNKDLTGDALYYKFGPYFTKPDPQPGVRYEEIEIIFKKKNAANQMEKIDSVTLDGRTDAIVLNLSAFDKFFLPYYTRLYGADIAQEWRKIVKDDFEKSTTFAARPSHGDATYLSNIPRSNQ